MQCWSCKKDFELETRKVPFSGECPHCTAWLHVCKNCRFYKPGLPNDCKVPGTELVADREKKNLCEEFELKLVDEEGNSPSISDVEKKLFGESSAKDKPSDPEDAFNRFFNR